MPYAKTNRERKGLNSNTGYTLGMLTHKHTDTHIFL